MNILQNLKLNKRVSKDLEALIAGLTLEELIQLKIFISAKAMGYTPYGLAIWKKIPIIAKDAIVHFAATHFSKEQASARFMKMNLAEWRRLKTKYGYPKVQKKNDYAYDVEGNKV